MQKWKRPQSSKTTTKPELRLALAKSGVSGSLCPTAKLRSRNDGRITRRARREALAPRRSPEIPASAKTLQRTAENDLRSGSWSIDKASQALARRVVRSCGSCSLAMAMAVRTLLPQARCSSGHASVKFCHVRDVGMRQSIVLRYRLRASGLR